MTIPILLATALALGVDWKRVALLAGAAYLPLVVGALVVIAVWRARSIEDHRPGQFCEAVAAELRAGANLRDALVSSANSSGMVVAPEIESGSLQELADGLSEHFPRIGQELRLTVVTAARSGSDVASLFDEIGSLAMARVEIEREVRMATAPGKATALLFVGAPAAYLVAQAMSGNLERMLRAPQQRAVGLIGLGLFAVGLVATCWVVWRAGR